MTVLVEQGLYNQSNLAETWVQIFLTFYKSEKKILKGKQFLWNKDYIINLILQRLGYNILNFIRVKEKY